jgi:hypothetical protein
MNICVVNVSFSIKRIETLSKQCGRCGVMWDDKLGASEVFTYHAEPCGARRARHP